MKHNRLVFAAVITSLVVCIVSVLALALHLGPMQDKLKTPWARIDGRALWLGLDPFVYTQSFARTRLGVLHGIRATIPATGLIAVGIDLWFLAVVSAPLPIGYFLYRRNLIRTTSRGQCLTCGYDLRGTPNRCPECGREVLAAEPLPLPDSCPIAVDEKIAIVRRLSARS